MGQGLRWVGHDGSWLGGSPGAQDQKLAKPIREMSHAHARRRATLTDSRGIAAPQRGSAASPAEAATGCSACIEGQTGSDDQA